MKRRILSIITALALCLSLCPTWALAAEADPSLCKHHPEHTEDCGYTAPTEGHDCGHGHTAECYTLGVLPDADSGDPYEIGGDTENLLDCHHSHDSECGYVQADPGTPCGYECRICPIEDLIAALPEQVTEDNAADVRGQLDHILDLYRELNEDEQEEINLTRIYALQGALDNANAPMQAAEEINISQNLNNILTADEGDCPGHTFTGTTANVARIYVGNGVHNVTFSGLNISTANVGIAPGATMNLTIEGTNEIKSNSYAGIYVPENAALVITAESTGTLDVSSSADAGIGGGTYDSSDPTGSTFGDPNCGTVVINGGIINATGGSGCAGIGGGSGADYSSGNGGTVIISGGTVTATGGSDGTYGGAGIGGSAGASASDPAGNGGTLTINGGTVNLTAGTHDPQYPAYGFGQGTGKAPGGTCELTLADASYLDSGTTLDPKGKYTINGDPTADMIVVPTDLVYTGQAQDLTGKIYIDDTKTGTGTYFNQTFTVKANAEGWTYAIDPSEVKAAGEYTVTFSKEGHTPISKKFTVAECPHTGTTFAPAEGEDGTHTGTCPTCDKTITGTCEYPRTYESTADGHVYTCTVCGGTKTEAHTIALTAAADPATNTVTLTGGCNEAGCGYTYTLGNVKFTFPKVTYGQTEQTVTLTGIPTDCFIICQVEGGSDLQSQDGDTEMSITLAQLFGSTKVTAGGHKMKVSFFHKAGVYSNECELDFTIDPAPLTPSITGTATKTFDGTTACDGTGLSIALDGVVGGDTVTATAASYAYDSPNAGERTITATGITLAGDDKANYTLSSTTATTTGTITKATVSITWDSTTQTVTYTGKTAGITAPTVTAEGGVAVSVTPTYSYHQEDGEAGHRDGLPTNAGTYSIVASIKESSNLTAARADMMLTINKAPLTIDSATIKPKTYDTTTTATVENVTFTGLVNGEALALSTDYTATGTFADANAGENKSVTVTVTLTSDKAKNYSLAQNTTATTSTITKASSTITTAPTASGIAYGQALSDSTLTGGVGSVAGAFTWTTPATKPNAGTAQYEVTFTPDNPNYSTAKVNVSVTAAKATPTLAAPTASAIQYGQKLSDSPLTGGSAVNPYDNTAVAGSWSWASGNTQPTATGDFPVAFVPSDTANYNTPENVDTSVTVNPAAPKITLTVPAYQIAGGEVTVTYTVANPHNAALTDLPAVTLTYKVGSGAEQPITDGRFTIPEGTAVDTVITVTASTAAVDGKYTAATKTATVTVTDKIPVEISGVGVTGRAYNGKAIDHTGTPVIKTLDGKTVTDATVTYTWNTSGGTAPVNAGSYTLTISVDGEKYIGSTTVDFTIEKATVTITAANKSAVVGSAQPELTYTVSGLADGETLAAAPTLTSTPDMNTVGSYPITANGAAVPNTGNYNTEITYVAGTLTVTAKPSSGGGSYVPSTLSNPGSSTLPVTTTGQGSSTATTTTTAAPTVSVSNGTATTTINTAMGNEIVRQATANKSENVVIAPSVTGNVTKAEVSIPASTVGQIGSQTNASLTVSTPVADVTIPNGGLGSLGSAGGTVIVTAQQTGNSVELTVTAGGQTVQNVPGGVTLTVPAASTTPGTVAVLVHGDGTREVVRKSVADNGAVTIPLGGSAKLEIVDNSRQFADVPATSWAADAVAFASAHELFGGTGANQFSPDLPMSRGMLAVVLHNLENNPAQALTGAFADVDNSQWYAEGVAWAEA